MQNKKWHHIYDVYYSFFDKYKGHNQVVRIALYLGGPEFKFEPEDWLLWEAMIQYRHTGDVALLNGSDVVETWYRHTGDVATMTVSWCREYIRW